MADVLHWTPLPTTRALIFDCDGTLADTMPVHHRAWEAMLAEHGMVFPEVQFYAFAGMPTVGIIRRLAEEQGVTIADHQLADMTVDKERRYVDLIGEVRAIAEVHAIAEHYRGELPMAVASGGERWVVTETLQAIGILEWMDVLVCSEDTERHKPEPDVFLEAARRLGIEPAACTVFEDSDLGLEAGRRAGMQSIDIRPWR
jgi:HAD superfamily hydrolase (TIGR01509 family)